MPGSLDDGIQPNSHAGKRVVVIARPVNGSDLLTEPQHVAFKHLNLVPDLAYPDLRPGLQNRIVAPPDLLVNGHQEL